MKLYNVSGGNAEPGIYVRTFTDGDGDIAVEAATNLEFRDGVCIGFFSIDDDKLQFHLYGGIKSDFIELNKNGEMVVS
jgi:hypothetical protein